MSADATADGVGGIEDRARRARELAQAGAGASAVVEAQAAIVACVRRADRDRIDDDYLGLARTLMQVADVFGVYADPEMALEAAREGLSWAISAINEGQYQPDEAMYRAIIEALSVELALLEALGRTGEMANATSALTHFGEDPWPTMTAAQPAGEFGPTSRGVADATRQAALLAGDEGGLADMLLDNPVGPLCAPIFRMPPVRLLPAAATAGLAGTKLLAHDQLAGLRLGLEAHYLFAFAHEAVRDDSWSSTGEQILKSTSQPAAPPIDRLWIMWCELLAKLVTYLATSGQPALAVDLAEQATNVMPGIDWSAADRESAEDEVSAVFARVLELR